MTKNKNPLSEVFTAALQKFERGAAKYGTFEPATDTRDFLKEAEAEVLDAINYLAMFLVKMRNMKRNKVGTGWGQNDNSEN